MKRMGIVMVFGVISGLGPMVQPRPSAAPAYAQEEPTSATLPSGTTINAELKNSLDSKKLKPGDPVKLKTTEACRANGQIVLPKGSQLLGHVTQATVKGKGQNESTLGIALDKAILKNGEELPLSAVIQAMANADIGAPAPANTMPNSPLGSAGGSVGMGGARPGISGGGNPTTYPAPNPSNQPNPSNNPNPVPDATSPATTGNSNNGLDSEGNLAATSHGVLGLEGITLQPDTGGTQGSLILSREKSVHLSGGTKILLVTK